jgi:flagellar biosynthesis/type III secretory pathway protein FliH
MRSLSKIIKSSRVLYDRDPRVISFETTVVKGAELKSSTDVGQVRSKNALENADVTLRTAIDQVNEVKRRGQVDAQLAFLEAVNSGRQRGYEDGLIKGRTEGEERAKENVREAAQNFSNNACKLDIKYYNQMSKAKSDCINFAFGLAENILGIKINRENAEYKKVIDGFLSQQPSMATLAVDGGAYSFETLQTDGLLSCTDGLQGISVYIDTPRALIEADQSENRQEASEQAQENYETAASTQEAGSERSIFTEQNTKAQQTPEAEQSAEAEPTTDESYAVPTADATEEVQKAAVKEPIQAAETMQSAECGQASEPEQAEETEKTIEAKQPNMENTQSTDNNLENDETAIAEATDEADFKKEADNLANPIKADDEEYIENNENLNSEKFVFVRPARKPALKAGANKQAISFENFEKLPTSTIKAISKKADIEDITAALSGADEEIVSTFMAALPRRTKEKVLDVMKYLGPVPQSDVDAARQRLANIAADIEKARERDETDA